MAHRPDLAISVSNYSRRYSTTPCANVLLDEVVLNFFKSPALWAGLFTEAHTLCYSQRYWVGRPTASKMGGGMRLILPVASTATSVAEPSTTKRWLERSRMI